MCDPIAMPPPTISPGFTPVQKAPKTPRRFFTFRLLLKLRNESDGIRIRRLFVEAEDIVQALGKTLQIQIDSQISRVAEQNLRCCAVLST